MGTGQARGSPSKDQVKSPAPNAYNQSRNTTLFKNPSWRMGTSKRRPLSARTHTPGPGNYTISNTKSGPAVRFRFLSVNYSME